MSKMKSDKAYVYCPECGPEGNRFQPHDRGQMYYADDGRFMLEIDQTACQCLKCLHVFMGDELPLLEGS